MKTRFVNIILIIILLFPWDTLQASSPSSENNNFNAHSTLSCLDCHDRIKEDPGHPSFEESSSSCIECHDSFPEYPHNRQYAVDCLKCHSRHHQKISHDTHSGISCKVCHLHDIETEKKMKNGIPVWGFKPGVKGEYDPHLLTAGKDTICSRCHYKGNIMGASDHALPAKSIICMPCHAATISIGDISSLTAIIIFLTGIISIVFLWFAAGKSYRRNDRTKKIDFISLIGSLIFDVFFQQKLLKVSVMRWIIHGMIFIPFVIRFLWGIISLALSLFNPEWDVTWMMLDKNNPVTGMIFDITGLMILMAGCLMVIEKKKNKKLQNIRGLPKSNTLVNSLLGGMIITGFIVEGARIAMTGSPEGSQFAFIGYLISRILLNYHLNGVYAYLWHLHAVLTAVFIACLPFSRMFHIFTAPLSLLLSKVSKE